MAIKAAQVKELREKTNVGMMDAKKALVETDGDMEKAIDFLREKGMAKAAKKAGAIAAEGMTYVAVKGNFAAIIELNSQTDFVAGNKEFNDLLHAVAETIVDAKPATVEEALELPMAGKTMNEEIIHTTQITGEKITLRRFAVIEAKDGQVLGAYSHMGGRISSLVLLDGANAEVAKDVAMHVAAINPQYVSREEVPADTLSHEKEIQLAAEDLNGKPDAIKEKIVEGRLNKFLSEISLVDQAFVKGDGETVAAYVEGQNGKVLSFVRYEVGEGIEKAENDFAAEVAAQIK
ncbi:translation elongation factor Ts [Weissella koreensis]|uniref:Elongation factor Ts n=1 Tax=Weissella koreensis TaxID=165096 RepID=A0A7H1MN38_9LACO|nr:translation elongation factor Ts [Weissella koreensis]AEJ24056.1 elongation factor Ts [Weissella koreensis KACC 15510]AVH75670.1 elongation factor Ts [Weissella koreensis]EJF34657.1 translation elongation factor Ts [Weissella koreensis KCTC 3621]QGN20893.1 elongation factor Ts [Weissella koreensis]QNT64874.1 elongation factor Ts [Weissella koreensis]